MATLKTKDGQVFTEDMIEALAREAEVGYDPAALRPRRVGRPPLGGQPSRRVQFRVDAATYAILQERAQAERREISEIVRTALERYLSGEPAER